MNTKTHLAQRWMLDSELGLLTALKHVPDDKLNWSPSPTSRTPLQIAIHAALMTHMVGDWLGDLGGTRVSYESIIAKSRAEEAKSRSRAEVEQMISTAAHQVIQALRAMTNEQFEGELNTPFGPRPIDSWSMMPALHMDTHAGQISYLQTLWGDMENHPAQEKPQSAEHISHPVEAIDLAEAAVKDLKGSFRMLLLDLENLPEAAFDQKFGGKTRTVADIVHEVNLVNDHVGLTIRGEELFDWPEGWITAPEGQKSKEGVITAFKTSSDRIMEMVQGFAPVDMARKVTTDRGETTVMERCRFMALHAWYHSGQLNFIQTLNGDDGWYW